MNTAQITPTRQRDVTALALDPEALLELGRAAYVATYGEAADPAILRNAPLPQMLAHDAEGTVSVINGEGVGCTATAEGTVGVYFDNGGTWFALDLAVEDVLHSTGEQTPIDLADGIRTFGARLDANFSNWRYRLLGRLA